MTDAAEPGSAMPLGDVPAPVRDYLALLGPRTPAQDQALRALLADDVRFSFAGSDYDGKDAALAQVSRMPSRPGAAALDWQTLPGGSAMRLTLRAAMPPNAPGGLVALDYAFELNTAGAITRIAPFPHHRTPDALRPSLQPGEPAADFTLPDTNGAPVSLRSPDAKAYVVIWTCNHCPWALAWHDRIQAVVTDYAGRHVRSLQLNANDPLVSPHDSLDACRARADAMAGPYLIDAGQRVARQWGARHTPEIFVLDANLVVAYHGAPDASHADPARGAEWLRAALDAVLAERTVALAQTTPIGCTVKWTLAPV